MYTTYRKSGKNEHNTKSPLRFLVAGGMLNRVKSHRPIFQITVIITVIVQKLIQQNKQQST